MLNWIKKNKVLTLIVAILPILGTLADYFAGDKIKATFNELSWKNPAIEEFKDNKFNILVLNFGKTCKTEQEGEVDIGLVISNRLRSLKVNDTLDIGVYYENNFTPDLNFTSKKSRKTSKKIWCSPNYLWKYRLLRFRYCQNMY